VGGSSEHDEKGPVPLRPRLEVRAPKQERRLGPDLLRRCLHDVGPFLKKSPEHLQNGGAVRDWIARRQVGDINEYMARANDPNCRTFLQSIVSAYEQGIIDEATAIASCGNEAEFRRAARGIS
jgi:hypothetical protein